MKRNLIALFSLALIIIGYNSFASAAEPKLALKDSTKYHHRLK